MKKNFMAASLAFLTMLIVTLMLSEISVAGAVSNFNDTNFRLIWQQLDQPVQTFPNVGRSWTWGPDTLVGSPASEIYNGQPRTVQYFDKARMEVNDPNADRSQPFFVTTGLLVKELVTGLQQNGDNNFTPFPKGAATIPVAGDPNESGNNFGNPTAPTYASFRNVTTFNGDHSATSAADGTLVTSAIDKSGNVSNINPPASVKIAAKAYDSVTKHNIPDVFVNFQNQTGTTFDPISEKYGQGSVYFNNPLFVFGHPVSEPYWITTNIGGKPTTVLAQLFERRVLTYNPTNPVSFQVEMGNVGQHYYDWRYIANSPANLVTPTPAPNPVLKNDFSQFRANYNKTGNNQIPGEYNPINYNAGSSIHTSPAVDLTANLAVFGTDGNGVYAIDLTTGTARWIFQPKDIYFGGSPIIANGVVYIGANDGKIYAINEKDGTQKWTTPPSGARITATPATDGTYLYFASQDGKLYAYDLASGQQLAWSFNTGAELDNGPVLGPDSTAYVGNMGGQFFAIKNGQKVWQKTGDGGFVAQAALTSDGATLYVPSLSGTVYAYNSSDGSVKWSNPLTPGFAIYTTPAIYDNSLFVGSDNGSEYQLDLTNGNVNPMWIVVLPYAPHIRSSAAVVDGYVYFGADNNQIYVINANFANITRFHYATKAPVGTDSPVVNSGQLFFTSSDGHFILLK